MRRILAFVKQTIGLSVPAATTLQSPAETPVAVPDIALADARVRVSERQRKKAATAVTLAQAQTLLSSLHGDSTKQLVLRVTTSTATTYHVRAADALSAMVKKGRDVPLCDPAGELISGDGPTSRSRILLTDVLAETVELLPLPGAMMPDLNSVVAIPGGGIIPVEHSADAAKYELLPEADTEAASPREYPG